MGFKVMVNTGGATWDSNGLVFDTMASAHAYGTDLASRWTMVREFRVVDCCEIAKYTFDANTRTLTNLQTQEGHVPAIRVTL